MSLHSTFNMNKQETDTKDKGNEATDNREPRRSVLSEKQIR